MKSIAPCPLPDELRRALVDGLARLLVVDLERVPAVEDEVHPPVGLVARRDDGR